MKKLFTTLLFATPFLASAQSAYISADSTIILQTSAIEKYQAPDIFVDAQYHTLSESWVATLQIAATGATTDFVKTFQIEFTITEVDAFTGAGTTETDKVQNCILQAVADYLETLNPLVTFTLN